MYPYFHDGQIVVVNTRYQAGNLRKDDIVVFDTDTGYAVKRILACEGDHVLLKDGVISINSMKILPYTYDGDAVQEYDLEDGQYFMVGDNYSVSYDSRDYGPIESDAIVGKVVIKF